MNRFDRNTQYLALSIMLIAGFGWNDAPPAIAQIVGAPSSVDSFDTSRSLFARENLVAWCIVPFDEKKRGPDERAAMLKRLGIQRFAYDYRAEHIPSFDAEIVALKQHGIELTAWWFPPTLNDEARHILAVLKRHNVRPQLWVTGSGGLVVSEVEQQRRLVAEADRIRPITLAAAEIGCRVALYNHGGWFGEPENQIEVIRRVDLPNIGIVYNLHHGHEHVDRFPQLLTKMKPYLLALNLNGMDRLHEQSNAKANDRKILPIGAGALDFQLLKAIRDSGWRGPIGILNHTQHDAELRLQDNIDGLHWLVSRMEGRPALPAPTYRTHQRP